MLLHRLAANRDADDFPGPFNVVRSLNRHLAIEFGAHRCLGSFIAKAETRVLAKKGFARLPGCTGADEVACQILNRGMPRLGMEFDPGNRPEGGAHK